MLDYHIELHYSQTQTSRSFSRDGLDYHIELHYSQTRFKKGVQYITLDYHIEYTTLKLPRASIIDIIGLTTI